MFALQNLKIDDCLASTGSMTVLQGKGNLFETERGTAFLNTAITIKTAKFLEANSMRSSKPYGKIHKSILVRQISRIEIKS